MSGIDECFGDIPKCPSCRKRPEYWTISTMHGPTLWFFSVEYRRRREEMYKISFDIRGEGHYRDLEGDFLLTKAACMSGCGREARPDDHPEIFKIFYKMFEMFFPDDIKRTD